MDTRGRGERIEKLLAMEAELDEFEDLPLSERFRKLLEWPESHLSPAEQEWLYQQWQRALECYLEEPADEPSP
jgi:hypothetical protein